MTGVGLLRKKTPLSPEPVIVKRVKGMSETALLNAAYLSMNTIGRCLEHTENGVASAGNASTAHVESKSLTVILDELSSRLDI